MGWDDIDIRTFPPNTSSPMIKHPAVCIKLFCCCCEPAITDDVIDGLLPPTAAADTCAKFAFGRDKCRTIWFKRLNICWVKQEGWRVWDAWGCVGGMAWELEAAYDACCCEMAT